VKTCVIILIAVALMLCWEGCDTTNNMEDPNKNSYLRLLGNDGDQHGVDIAIDTTDNSLFVLGQTGPVGSRQLYVVHLNSDGFVIWERTLGGVGDDEARDIEILSNKTDLVILAMVSEVSDPLNRDFVIRRITKAGIPIDSATHGDPGFAEEAYSVTETSDSFIVSGSTNHTLGSSNPSDALLFRVNISDLQIYQTGDWNNSYGKDGVFEAAVKTIKVDTTFYVFGHTNEPETGSNTADNILDYNVFVWVLGSNGVPAYPYLIGDSLIVGSQPGFDEIVSSVALVPTDLGGGYAVSGYSFDPSSSTQRIFTMTIKRDLSGVPVNINTKNKRLLLPDDPRLDDDTRSGPTTTRETSVFVSRSGFLVLGAESVNGNENIYLKKLDNDLHDAWLAPSFFTFGGIDNDNPGAVAESPDGHIMVVGTMYLGEPPSGQTKVLLMKLSPRGKLGE
jgi:hypothetical protein